MGDQGDRMTGDSVPGPETSRTPRLGVVGGVASSAGWLVAAVVVQVAWLTFLGWMAVRAGSS